MSTSQPIDLTPPNFQRWKLEKWKSVNFKTIFCLLIFFDRQQVFVLPMCQGCPKSVTRNIHNAFYYKLDPPWLHLSSHSDYRSFTCQLDILIFNRCTGIGTKLGCSWINRLSSFTLFNMGENCAHDTDGTIDVNVK